MALEMKEYTKIDTVFNRDIFGTKKLIEGDYRSIAVKYLSKMPWRFTEKIDGTNIGVRWDGHRVSYQGRTERAQIPTHLMNKLIEIFGSDETEELFEQVFGEKEVILFGEGYGAKIQKGGGNYIQDGCSFILFDVYMVGSNTWLEYDNVADIATTFGIDVVPVVMTGTIDEAVEYIKTKPQSTINEAHEMEGVVGKPIIDMYDRNHKRIIVKIKVRDFV